MLAELVLHPEKMEGFKKLDRIIGNDLFKDDTKGLCKKMQAYFRYESLISQLDENTITDVEVKNLREVLNDRYYDEYSAKATDFIPIETLDDLRAYAKTKSEIYGEAINKCSSLDSMKQLIFLKLFGMDHQTSGSDDYNSEALKISQMIRMYQTESFINDERTLNSGLFTQDELDAVGLISIIDKVNDVDVLRQLYEELDNSELEVLNAIDFKKIREKIPLQYSKEFIDSLMTYEKAQKMVENGESGISIEYTEENVPIVKLQGANFRMIMHSTGLENSGLTMPRGLSVDQLWKTFEDGVTTISCCPIEGDMLKSCNNCNGVNIGFSQMDPSLIIGMGHTDIHVTHMKRRLDTTFNYGHVHFNYPDELVRKTAAQINHADGESKDPSHEYGEITTTRYDQHVERGSNLYRDRRIMPDCIIVYGKDEGNKTSITELAKAFARDGKPIPVFEIDTDKYGDRSYNRAYEKENHVANKADSVFMKKAKEIADSKEKE